MAKQSYLLQQIQLGIDKELAFIRPFILHEVIDYATIAFGDWYEEKMGEEADPETVHEYTETLKNLTKDFAKLALQDARDDKQINYVKGKIDQRLQPLLGPYFKDFEARYGL